MSTFSGLSTALSALYASQRGMDVSSQNVANANTEGYSRQRVDLQAAGGPTVPAIWSVWSGAGQGVDVAGIQRLRDTFLELRGQTEHGKLSYLQGLDASYGQIEQSLGEPSDTGIQSQLADFWAGWHDVANAPGDTAARSQLLQRAQTLTDGLNKAADALKTQWTQTREQLSTSVDSVNTTASTVAQLNQAILRAEQAGLPDSELKDQRDTLVMKLADGAGARVVYGKDGVADVYLGGTALVKGSDARQLQVVGATTYGAGNVSVAWVSNPPVTPPQSADISSGSTAAFVQTLNAAIPGVMGQLDAVASSVVSKVNAVHTSSYDLDGNLGVEFFDSTGTTAATIHVNTAVSSDPRKVAAAKAVATTPPLPATQDASLDAGAADDLARLGAAADSPDATYRTAIVDLGVQAQTATRRATIQADVANQVDAARDAQAGVNLDEEMVNLVQFQHAYEAAARVMTSIDQNLDTLIHNTGLVGR